MDKKPYRYSSRGRSDHLTDAELDIIRRGHADGRTQLSLAVELRCSTRTIQKYFRQIRSGVPFAAREQALPREIEQPAGPMRVVPKDAPPKVILPPKSPRHYFSNFEPT